MYRFYIKGFWSGVLLPTWHSADLLCILCASAKVPGKWPLLEHQCSRWCFSMLWSIYQHHAALTCFIYAHVTLLIAAKIYAVRADNIWVDFLHLGSNWLIGLFRWVSVRRFLLFGLRQPLQLALINWYVVPFFLLISVMHPVFENVILMHVLACFVTFAWWGEATSFVRSDWSGGATFIWHYGVY